MPPATTGVAARHHAAARGRGRDAAAASFPSAAATAAQRCAAFVAAVVRASEDPELALGALHVARREVRNSKTPQTQRVIMAHCACLLSIPPRSWRR